MNKCNFLNEVFYGYAGIESTDTENGNIMDQKITHIAQVEEDNVEAFTIKYKTDLL